MMVGQHSSLGSDLGTQTEDEALEAVKGTVRGGESPIINSIGN